MCNDAMGTEKLVSLPRANVLCRVALDFIVVHLLYT